MGLIDKNWKSEQINESLVVVTAMIPVEQGDIGALEALPATFIKNFAKCGAYRSAPAWVCVEMVQKLNQFKRRVQNAPLPLVVKIINLINDTVLQHCTVPCDKAAFDVG